MLRTWFVKNRDLKDLLEMLPEDAIEDICLDFKLDSGGEFDTLIRRIIKSGIIGLPKEQSKKKRFKIDLYDLGY